MFNKFTVLPQLIEVGVNSIFFSHYVSKLQPAANPILNNIINAIVETYYNSLNDEQKIFFRKIEKLRKSYYHNTTTIQITNYSLSAEGKIITKKLKDVIKSSKREFWCRLLFNIIEKNNISHGLEFGTNLGISAAYQALALKGNSQLITVEGDPTLSQLARNNLEALNIFNVSVINQRFTDAIEYLKNQNKYFDYFFNDGHHDYEAVISYFQRLTELLSDQSIIVLDDIRWSKPMYRAWQWLKNHQHIEASIDLGIMGICIYSKNPNPKTHIKLHLAKW
ncbi:MAG: class I SAM-dependent methyltransferase [Candidatus Micrarchaeia archaeon]